MRPTISEETIKEALKQGGSQILGVDPKARDGITLVLCLRAIADTPAGFAILSRVSECMWWKKYGGDRPLKLPIVPKELPVYEFSSVDFHFFISLMSSVGAWWDGKEPWNEQFF